MSERAFLFVVASARSDGNSERLARRAAAALPEDTKRTWLALRDQPLPPFSDLRHAPGGFPPPSGVSLELAHATLAATDLVIVTPVYWYSLPAAAKLYLDYWSAWMRATDLEFSARMRGRNLWAVIVDSSEPAERAYAPLVDSLILSAQYMEMRWMGALHGHGNRAGDALNDAATLAAADRFFLPG